MSHNPGGGAGPSSPRSTLLYPPGSPTSTQQHGLPLSLAEVEEEGHDSKQGVSSSSGGGGAHSIISSPMDIDKSDDGESEIIGPHDAPDSGRKSRPGSFQPPLTKINKRGSGGEYQMDTFSRPSTAASSTVAKNWANQPPPSRRGFTPSIRARPTSSASRTHVPSLTSHAFYRPMSSAKLQAQRGKVKEESEIEQNRLVMRQQSFGTELSKQEDATSTARRSSLGGQGGVGAYSNRRDTFSDADDHLQFQFERSVSVSPTGQQALHSQTSVAPLHTPEDEEPKTARNGQSSNSGANGRAGAPGSSSSSGGPSKAPMEEEDDGYIDRNFDHFPGNTNFCCWGRFQTANDLPMNVLTAILVILPSGLFFGYSAKYLWYNISPALPIIFAYTFLICISSFLKAAASDPGIYPRNVHPLEADDSDDPLAVLPTNGWARMPAHSKNVLPLEVPIKYCPTCRIWRPPRCHHCRVCDNCIETHDHHCVWLNNCVGRRNYRYFFTFVSSATLLAFYLLACETIHLISWKNSHTPNITFRAALNTHRIPFALLIFAALAAPYPLALTTYHLFLMARGQTTREYLLRNKSRPRDKHRPFDQLSVVKNYVVVLCRPRPPTYVQLKQRFVEGDQRFELRRRIPVMVGGNGAGGSGASSDVGVQGIGGDAAEDEGGVEGGDGGGSGIATGSESRAETVERRVLAS